MALNGRVNPSCAYVSNPYHQCTEACLQKTKQTEPQRIKKSSGYGRSVTDGELAKKINEGRRTHSGCPKASNPYHRCDENCAKILTGSDATPSKFEGEKKLDSKPQPPVLDSVPASKVGAIHLSDASSPISNYSENKKVEPSEDICEETHIPDIMPIYHKDLVKDGAEHVDNPIQTNQEDKIASHKVAPITSADESGEGLATSGGGSIDYSVSGIPRENENSDEGESESVISESRIPVGRYQVKQSFAPILRSIIEKYGDIGASCHLESVAIRSYYIECVCSVFQELQSASKMQLSMSKVEEWLAIVKDVESAQLDVAWLRSIVDEIAENMDVEVAKANLDHEVGSLREELESQLEGLAQKEQEVADIKTRIPQIRDRLAELELKSSELDHAIYQVQR